MPEGDAEKSGCLRFLRDLILLLGKIVLAEIVYVFSCILPDSKKSLKDEVVLVTGAGRGLGRDLALKFAALEAVVVLWDIHEKNVFEVEKEIKDAGGRAHGYVCDVTVFENVKRVGAKVRQDVGDVTILVNNAGVIQNRLLLDLDINKIKRTFDVNIISHFWTIKYFLPKMMENNKGHIVAVSSVAGFIGWLYMTDYCATKFAIVGMMEAIEEELRILGKGDVIRCTTACPVTMSNGFNHNPTTRLPRLAPILTTEFTAASIVGAVQRNERVVTIPRRAYYPITIQRLFPRKVIQLVLDFLEYNVQPNNEI